MIVLCEGGPLDGLTRDVVTRWLHVPAMNAPRSHLSQVWNGIPITAACSYNEVYEVVGERAVLRDPEPCSFCGRAREPMGAGLALSEDSPLWE